MMKLDSFVTCNRFIDDIINLNNFQMNINNCHLKFDILAVNYNINPFVTASPLLYFVLRVRLTSQLQAHEGSVFCRGTCMMMAIGSFKTILY